MKRYEIAIIIVNFRTPNLVIDCVRSCLSQVNKMDAAIIIVDNHSADESVSRISAWAEENAKSGNVTVLESQVNRGFSGANNYGIQSVKADYYLLLNSDTIVRPGAIEMMVRMAKEHRSAGIYSPRLEYTDTTPQESCFNFHRPISELLHSSGTGAIDWLLSRYVVRIPVSDVETRPDWTSFACVLIRKEVVESVGQMDDDFFMYYEDAEFCFRARKAGWHVLNVPDAKVVHLRGGSSSVKSNAKLRKRLPRYYYESRTKYYYKCFGWTGLLFANISWVLGRSISLLRELAGNKDQHICEKEWLDIWTNFFAPNSESVMYKNSNK